jgi:ABC-2 type transport system permease protein
MRKLLAMEAKLVVRDAMLPLFGIGLPVALLLAFGFIPDTRHADAHLGGLRDIDTVIPSLAAAVALAMIGMLMLPIYLANYRERGILRRLATTPARPRDLLGAQLIVHLVVAIATIVLVLGIGVSAMDMTAPKHPAAFLLAITLGVLALFAVGLVIAALAPNARVANGIGLLAWFASAYFAGIYQPKELMPHALSRIGDFTPLGAARASIQDAWGGAGPTALHLAVLAVVVVVGTTAAVRLFRWQ